MVNARYGVRSNYIHPLCPIEACTWQKIKMNKMSTIVTYYDRAREEEEKKEKEKKKARDLSKACLTLQRRRSQVITNDAESSCDVNHSNYILAIHLLCRGQDFFFYCFVTGSVTFTWFPSHLAGYYGTQGITMSECGSSSG
jgi:hypothetical protein